MTLPTLDSFLHLMSAFINYEITPKQFEEKYDLLWKDRTEKWWDSHNKGIPFEEIYVLQDKIAEHIDYIFTSTDCFTEDEQAIQEDPGFNISGEQMRQEVQEAYDKIMQILNKS
jgi:Bacterial self-protective colicin-like immunity